MLRKFAPLAGAAATMLCALALGAAPAAAEGPPVAIQISSNAKLLPDGSALLAVTYSCFNGFGSAGTGTLFSDLEQSQAAGSQSTTVTCDDQNHTISLDEAPGPFVPGEAAANVTIFTGFNEYGQSQAEVNISSH